MYRDSTFKVHAHTGNWRLQRRVLAGLCVLLLAGVVILGVLAVRNAHFRRQTQTQISQRILSAVAAAIDETNRMSSIITSNTPARLARVRQYVYHAEQMNNLNMVLQGGEGGRLAPAEAFIALYQDLDSLESIIQASTSSTQDGRTALLAHLVMLEEYMNGK